MITKRLLAFLRQFSTPHQLDTPELEMERVRITAEAINSRISADATDDQVVSRMESALETLVRSHRGASWPSPAHFVEAMDQVAPPRPVEARPEQITDFNMSPRRRRFLNLYRLRGIDPKYVIRPDERGASLTGRMCNEEWRRHVSAMARLNGREYGEQEAIERRETSPELLPPGKALD